MSLLAGQSWDVISPIVPTTLNYSVGWWVGDIGYRRPQLRLTKGFAFNKDTRLQFELAAARTIGDSNIFGPGDTGEDADFPSMQGRLSLAFPGLTKNKTILGLSGHWGQEEYDYNTDCDEDEVDTWSLNFDATVPLLDWLMLKGTIWTGENLDAYLGGIAQGIVVSYLDTDDILRREVNATSFKGTFVDVDPIASSGGWAQLGFGPFNKWKFNLGYSIDDPKDKDVPDGSRIRNQSWFGNAIYSLNEAVELGLELSYWDTDYKAMADGDSVRIQTAVTYKF